MMGAFDLMVAMIDSQEKVQAVFGTGGGVPWDDHTSCFFCAVGRFFRPGYHNNLVSNWLPALDGVVKKLERGAKIADVGCGHGWSTVIMAKAFPNSQFIGYDFHPSSIEHATAHAREHGVTANTRFEAAAAKNYQEKDFDLVAFFDCLHDMGDPAGAAAHVRQSLKPDGSWMIIEPIAGDRLEDNLNPVGRIYYAGSTLGCIPTSLAQEVGAALGAQAGEARLREVITAGGLRSVRRAAETAFNMILEARPSLVLRGAPLRRPPLPRARHARPGGPAMAGVRRGQSGGSPPWTSSVGVWGALWQILERVFHGNSGRQEVSEISGDDG